jgi:alkanesulfonate monooxygenase SsuD/methylene tetrahydromethanopterin reductase-like flavin-dependent oxidoreductase (luciferase family)
MGLEFGIWDHFDRVPGVAPSRQYEDRIAFVQRAEEHGIYGYHLAEHHNSSLCMTPSPLLFLAALAARTKTIRLGTLVLLAPTYPLLRLLEDVSVVDQLADGRLLLGLGPGVRETELVWLGADPTGARERAAEVTEAIRRAFADGIVTLPGRDGRDGENSFRYASPQRPHPSLWRAGSLERAAAEGMNVIGTPGPGVTREAIDGYWAAFDAADGGDPWTEAVPRVGTTRHVVVADTDDEALAIARRAWPVHADYVFEVPFETGGRAAVRGTSGMNVGEDADTVLARRGALIAGSPETVRDALGEYLDIVGPGHNYLVGAFQWGDIRHDEAIASLELYCTEVVPALAVGLHTQAAAS